MLLEWLYILLVVSPVVTEYCPPNNNTGAPHFTKTPAGQDDFSLQRAGKLFCCATGVDSILWERKGRGWEPYPWAGPDAIELKNGNQSLQILSFSMQDDTTFRCSLVKNRTVVTVHSMRIYVHSCLSTRGPMLIMPFPEDTTIEKLGVTVKLYCTGYFGCNSFDFKIVEWCVKDTNKRCFGDKIKEYDSRYSITTSGSVEGNRLISKVLTIHNVQAIDLQRRFVCRVTNAQMVQKNNMKQVSISLIEIPDYKWYIISIGGGVVFLLVLMGIMYKCYGPQIRLRVLSRINLFAPKTITEEEITNNVFMYVADDDRDQGNLIVEKLKAKGYKVYTTTDVLGNESKFAAYERGCKGAAIVFFLYSKNLREDPLADFFLQSLVNEGKRILFIEIDYVVEQEMNNWMANTIQRPNTEDRLEQDAVDHVPIENPEENEVEGAVQNDNRVLNMKFWKSLPRYKLPSEDSSKRKKNNFWCSLQNKIPKFEHQKKTRTRTNRQRHSSQHPLLETPLASPNHEIQDQISPNTDQVFVFNEMEGDQTAPKVAADPNATPDNDNQQLPNMDIQSYRPNLDNHDDEAYRNSEESLVVDKVEEVVNVDVHKPENHGNRNDSETIGVDDIENRVLVNSLPTSDTASETGVFELSGENPKPNVEHQNVANKNAELSNATNLSRTFSKQNSGESGYGESPGDNSTSLSPLDNGKGDHSPSLNGNGELSPLSSNGSAPGGELNGLNGDLSPMNSTGDSRQNSQTGFSDGSDGSNKNLHIKIPNQNGHTQTTGHQAGNGTRQHLTVNINGKNRSREENSVMSPESGYITSSLEQPFNMN